MINTPQTKMWLQKELQSLLSFTRSQPHFVLYGAGKIGLQALDLLHTLGARPEAFVVTQDTGTNQIGSLPVYTPKNLPFLPTETAVLLTASPHVFDDMEQTLIRNGFTHYRPLITGISDAYFNSAAILEITTRIGCAVNCSFCPQALLLKNYFARDPQRPSEFTMERFEACLSTVPSEVMITFSGMSEPWGNKLCTDMVLHAHKKGHPIAVYTTMRGMQPEDFERISHIPFCDFVLHVPDEQGNADIPITAAYLDLLKQVFSKRTSSGKPFVTDFSCHGTLDPRLRELLGYSFDGSGKLQDRAGNLEDSTLQHRQQGGPIVCMRSQRRYDRNILLPDGSVVLCCMDYGLRYPIGNLLDIPYKTLFCSDTLRNVKKLSEENGGEVICRQCADGVPLTYWRKWFKGV